MHQYAGGWQTKDQQLVAAVKANQPKQVRRLLLLRADPNWVDSSQASQKEVALHLACQQKDSVELVQLLLDGKACPDVADIDGWRPVHWASYHNADAALALLIEHGVDVNVPNRNGETPLHWACKNNCARAVRVLGSSAALSLDQLCARQESARDWAARNHSEDALRELYSLLDTKRAQDTGA